MSRFTASRQLRLYSFYTRAYCYTKLKRCRFKPWVGVVLVGLLVVFINESLFYRWSQSYWPDIDALGKKPTVERILLVADPQLIGEKDEFLVGFFTRRDADRYLAKTFAQVSAYVRPHWVLFLGDIFDEGLSASDEEFKRYFERFDAIFDYRNREHRYLIVPGDNDVGGEYYGDKQPLLRQRFRNYFGRSIALYHQNDIQFLKLDVDLFDSYGEGKRELIMEQTQNRPMTAIFRIVINHWPILQRTARFVKPFLNELEPNLIVKGDSHHFTITAHDRTTMQNRILMQEFLTEPFVTLDAGQKTLVHEISVPSCSYRMGVQRIGYAVLLLDSDTKSVHVTVLFTPRRYVALCIYLVYAILAVLFLIVTSLFSRRTLMQLLVLFR